MIGSMIIESPRINIPMGKYLQIPHIAYAVTFCAVQGEVFRICVVTLVMRVVQRGVIVYISLNISGKKRALGLKIILQD